MRIERLLGATITEQNRPKTLDEGQFDCPLCDFACSSERLLARHYAVEHPDKHELDEALAVLSEINGLGNAHNAHECPHCLRHYTKEMLARHIPREHPETTPVPPRPTPAPIHVGEALRAKHVHALVTGNSPPVQDKVQFFADRIEHGIDYCLSRINYGTSKIMQVSIAENNINVRINLRWNTFADPELGQACQVRIGVSEPLARFPARLVQMVQQAIMGRYQEQHWTVQIDSNWITMVHPQG